MHVSNERSRTGCLSCRRRHYKCDEAKPQCLRCRLADIDCEWPWNADVRGGPQSPRRSRQASEGSPGQIALDSPVARSAVSPIPHEISTWEEDFLQHYLSQFHNYSFLLCAWTDLIDLPKRSILPDILRIPTKNTRRRLTNWANFYLLHLATGSVDDPLTCAIAAYTALWMGHRVQAISFYLRVLRSLQRLLNRHDASDIGNQEFLRAWTGVLLLALYEHRDTNHTAAATHLDGATTMCLIAAEKFPIALGEYADRRQRTLGVGRNPQVINPQAMEISSSQEVETFMLDSVILDSQKTVLPRNEMELPFYLMRLTKLYRHINLVVPTIDIDWPDFWQADRPARLAPILEKSSECFAHVQTLVQDVYVAGADERFPSVDAYERFLAPFQSRYVAARRVINEYTAMLEDLRGQEYEVESSSAEKNFPFSPIIHFTNPQMVQPALLPSIFLVLLAPFLSDAEHYEALRHVSGILAGRVLVDGLNAEGFVPDILVASFWKRGPERHYFRTERPWRNPELIACIDEIWRQIDLVEDTQRRILNKVERLGIALKEWRRLFLESLPLQRDSVWQFYGLFSETFAYATGCPDPRTSPFSSAEQKMRRHNFPDVSFWHNRISVFREHNSNNMKFQNTTEATRLPSKEDVIPPKRIMPDATTIVELEVEAEDKIDEDVEAIGQTLGSTDIGSATTHPDTSSLYFII